MITVWRTPVHVTQVEIVSASVQLSQLMLKPAMRQMFVWTGEPLRSAVSIFNSNAHFNM